MRLLLALCIVVASGSQLFAQELSFIPDGVLSTSFAQETQSWDRVYVDRRSSRPAQIGALEQRGESDSVVSGDLSYSRATEMVDLLYGLGVNWNIGIKAQQVSYSRTSSLQNQDPSNQAVSDYVAATGSKTKSGLGDTEIFLNYRHFYTDYVLLVSGLFYREPTGSVEYDQANPLNLGTGLRQMGYRMLWDGFVSGTFLQVHGVAQVGFDGKKTVQDAQGQSQTLRGGVENMVSIELAHQLGVFHYGAGFSFAAKPNHTLNKRSVYDGQLSVDTWAKLGIGNLSSLEKGPVLLPWTFSLQGTHAYSGSNAPAASKLAARLSIYF